MSPPYQLFLSQTIPLVLYLKSYHHTKSHLEFFCVNSQEFYNFAFYIKVYHPFSVNIFERSVSRFLCFLICGCLVVPAPFVEESVFSPFYRCISSRSVIFSQKYSDIYVSLFLGSLFCSNGLFNCSITNTTLGYYSFIVSLEVRQCQSFCFVLLLQYWLFWVFCHSRYTLESLS